MSIALLDWAAEHAALQEQWLELLLASAPDSLALDVTTTAEWSESLRHSHLDGSPMRVAVAREGEAVTGIFPYFRQVERVRGLPCRKLLAISQLYSGRNRLLSREPRAFADALLDALLRDEPPWDWLSVTLGEGSESLLGLSEAAARRGLDVEVVSVAESPYIELPEDWDRYFDSLGKKFRWLLRNSRKKLSEAGRLEYRAYRSEAEVPALLEAIYEIEKASWKEDSGSSITLNASQQRFYELFSPAAARRGWLSGHVLTLDDEPIAYIYGIQLGAVFHDLKESYKQAVRDHSPGHVLKMFAMPDMIADGVRVYDFCGKCDAFKMKWTDLTYRRCDLVVHNRTVRARLLRTVGRMRSALGIGGPPPLTPPDVPLD